MTSPADKSGKARLLRYSWIQIAGVSGLLPAPRADGEWVRYEDAASLISTLVRERDEARDSAHNWHAQCQAIAAILDLHEPECLGFAGEVRATFEASHREVERLREALRPFAADDAMCSVDSNYAAARAALKEAGNG